MFPIKSEEKDILVNSLFIYGRGSFTGSPSVTIYNPLVKSSDIIFVNIRDWGSYYTYISAKCYDGYFVINSSGETVNSTFEYLILRV